MGSADGARIDNPGFPFSAVAFAVSVTDEDIIKKSGIHQRGKLTGIFLMKRGYTIYKADYKDYRALLEDAKYEFPGAELTAEDRVKYNLD